MVAYVTFFTVSASFLNSLLYCEISLFFCNSRVQHFFTLTVVVFLFLLVWLSVFFFSLSWSLSSAIFFGVCYCHSFLSPYPSLFISALVILVRISKFEFVFTFCVLLVVQPLSSLYALLCAFCGFFSLNNKKEYYVLSCVFFFADFIIIFLAFF